MKFPTPVCFAIMFVPLSAYAANTKSEGGPWWLEGSLTAIAILVSASVALYQLHRQHGNELALNDKSTKQNFYLQIYQEFAATIQAIDDKVRDANLYALAALTNVKIFQDQSVIGSFSPPPITTRALAFSEKHADALFGAVDALFLIEKYMIINPDLDIFRTAISSASHDARAAFAELHSFMLKKFPVEIPTGDKSELVNVCAFTPDDIQALEVLVGRYNLATADLGCYLSDLSVELQELLLGDLFPNKLAKRRPIDSKHKVISLEPASIAKLRRYFYDDTKWGKEAKQTMHEVHKLHNP